MKDSVMDFPTAARALAEWREHRKIQKMGGLVWDLIDPLRFGVVSSDLRSSATDNFKKMVSTFGDTLAGTDAYYGTRTSSGEINVIGLARIKKIKDPNIKDVVIGDIVVFQIRLYANDKVIQPAKWVAFERFVKAVKDEDRDPESFFSEQPRHRNDKRRTVRPVVTLG